MPKKEKVKFNDKATKMLYKEFISRYTQEYDVTFQEATRIIESVFELFKHLVITQNCVSIRGVGTFTVERGKKAMLRNYETGGKTEMYIRRKIAFVAAKSFRQSLNEKVANEIDRYCKKQQVIKKDMIRSGVINPRRNL